MCRQIVSLSGNLDGSTDARAPSRKHFERLALDSEKILKNEHFLVTSGNERGFSINNKFVYGPVLILPYVGFLHWKFDSVSSASPASVFLLSRLHPKIDTILIGAGETVDMPSLEFRKACEEHKIGLQIETTQQAISTYGLLLDDLRNFAALMVPATQKQISDSEKVYLQRRKTKKSKEIDS